MIKVLFSSLICSSIISLIGANACLAEDFRIYVKQQVEGKGFRPTFTKGTFSGVGQEDLYPFQRDPIDAISRRQFINKTMWLASVGGNWIEVGALNGWTSPNGMGATTFWKGNYYARSINGVYRREFLGKFGEKGEHFYSIRKLRSGPNNTWEVYISSGQLVKVIHPVSAFQVMQIGIETGNSCNSYKSGTFAKYPYYETERDGAQWNQNRLPVYNVDINNIDSVAIMRSRWDPSGNRVLFGRRSLKACR
jgi:hypothetical protein